MSVPHKLPRVFAAAIAAAALTLSVAACSSDKKDDGAATTTAVEQPTNTGPADETSDAPAEETSDAPAGELVAPYGDADVELKTGKIGETVTVANVEVTVGELEEVTMPGNKVITCTTVTFKNIGDTPIRRQLGWFAYGRDAVEWQYPVYLYGPHDPVDLSPETVPGKFTNDQICFEDLFELRPDTILQLSWDPGIDDALPGGKEVAYFTK